MPHEIDLYVAGASSDDGLPVPLDLTVRLTEQQATNLVYRVADLLAPIDRVLPDDELRALLEGLLDALHAEPVISAALKKRMAAETVTASAVLESRCTGGT